MRNIILEDGAHVIYVDEHSKQHDALITASWGRKELDLDDPNTYVGPINLVFVTLDPDRRDQYGQQKEHRSSCVHKSHQLAPGNYWLHPSELKP